MIGVNIPNGLDDRDGGAMNIIDWIVFGLVWSLIPLVWLLKGFWDRKRNKVYRETQLDIEKGIKILKKEE